VGFRIGSRQVTTGSDHLVIHIACYEHAAGWRITMPNTSGSIEGVATHNRRQEFLSCDRKWLVVVAPAGCQYEAKTDGGGDIGQVAAI